MRRAGCLNINDSAMDDILIIILLILLNGVFSMAEIAMISARKSRLTSDARQGSRGAATALKLADDPDKFLSTIQIGITLIGILTGLYSGAALAEDVGKLLQRHRPSASHLPNHRPCLNRCDSNISFYRGRRTGAQTNRPFISQHGCQNPVAAYVPALENSTPCSVALSASTSLIVKIFGLDKKDNSVTEEEIKSLIQMARIQAKSGRWSKTSWREVLCARRPTRVVYNDTESRRLSLHS